MADYFRLAVFNRPDRPDAVLRYSASLMLISSRKLEKFHEMPTEIASRLAHRIARGMRCRTGARN
jgi:hypothetical protein